MGLSSLSKNTFRAKERLRSLAPGMRYAKLVEQAVNDLLPLRKNRIATTSYVNDRLSPDIRYQHFLLCKELKERGNALQKVEPTYEANEGEVPLEVAREVRDELFLVIKDDPSFGYLFYVLGTEQNARSNSEPIDCIPDDARILEAITALRDDYPQSSLDGFINEKLNYEQYNLMQDSSALSSDEEYVDFFNQAYRLYDDLRLSKHSIAAVKQLLQSFSSDDKPRPWLFRYVMKLIETYDDEDEALKRCYAELSRLLPDERTDSSSAEESPVYLSSRKGSKIDIIRVLNTLYELGLFNGKDGSRLTKKDFMAAMGQAIHTDLSSYDKDFSRALSDSTAMEKHLRIFDEMRRKMEDIFNTH